MISKFRTVSLVVFLIFSVITIGFQISPAYATDKSHAENSAARLQQSLCKLRAHCVNATEAWPTCKGTGAGKYSCVGKFSYNNTSGQCQIEQLHADIAANNSASNAGSASSTCVSVANIVADLGTTKNTIPADFVGFSDDLVDVFASENSGSPIFTPSNTSLISLLHLLGPNGYARFGGNSQDVIDNGSALVAGVPPLTAPIAQHLAGFVDALGGGWTINYGLSGESNDPPANVAKAALILNAVAGQNPVQFSIGNEPNLWTWEKRAAPSLGSNPTSKWPNVFDRYYAALKAYDPSINIVAPELGKFDKKEMMSYINSTTPRLGPLALVAVHNYPVNCKAIDLSSILSSIGHSPWPAWSGWPNKMRLIESNLTACGGSAEYSPAFVSATFFLQMAIAAASNGWRGVGEHEILTTTGGSFGNGHHRTSYSDCLLQGGPGGPSDPTNPSGSDWWPAPCFYGWYLMSMMEGQPIVANTQNGVAKDVDILTTKSLNGNANILIVNGSANAIHIIPGQTSPWNKALVYQIGDAGGCKDTNPTLNNFPIVNGGSWNGNSNPLPKTINNGDPLNISGCGAAVVQIQSNSPPPPAGFCTAWYDTRKGHWLAAGSYGPWATNTCGMGRSCDCPNAVQSPGNTCGTYPDGGHSIWWPTATVSSTSCNNPMGGLDNIYCHGRASTAWESAHGCAPPNPAIINSYH